jgi:uncharacterized membrane protein YhhN
MTVWLCFTLVGFVGLLVSDYRQSHWLAYLFKPLASTGFIGVALAGGAFDTDYGKILLAALGLSWLGDFFLMFRRSALFLYGLVSFLLAHIAYSAAFVVRGQNAVWTSAALFILMIPAVMIAQWLRPHLDENMKRPVWAYIAVITVMLSLAFGVQGTGRYPLILVGAVAFYLSDISVARDRFVRRTFTNRLWGLPLYYGAQLLLAASIGI